MVNYEAFDQQVNMFGQYIRDEALDTYDYEIMRIDVSPLINYRFSKFLENCNDEGIEMFPMWLQEDYRGIENSVHLDYMVFHIILDFCLSGNSLEEVTEVLTFSLYDLGQVDQSVVNHADFDIQVKRYITSYIKTLLNILRNLLSSYIDVNNSLIIDYDTSSPVIKNSRSWFYKSSFISLEHYKKIGTGIIFLELYLFSKKGTI